MPSFLDVEAMEHLQRAAKPEMKLVNPFQSLAGFLLQKFVGRFQDIAPQATETADQVAQRLVYLQLAFFANTALGQRDLADELFREARVKYRVEL